MKLTGDNRNTREKTCLSALCPPQIPHGLTWNRTRASEVGGLRLTACAMARPPMRCFSDHGNEASS
jgi:hypothetical protein